jgi:hypothetical protein
MPDGIIQNTFWSHTNVTLDVQLYSFCASIIQTIQISMATNFKIHHCQKNETNDIENHTNENFAPMRKNHHHFFDSEDFLTPKNAFCNNGPGTSVLNFGAQLGSSPNAGLESARRLRVPRRVWRNNNNFALAGESTTEMSLCQFLQRTVSRRRTPSSEQRMNHISQCTGATTKSPHRLANVRRILQILF